MSQLPIPKPRPPSTSGVIRVARTALPADWVELAQQLRMLADPAVAAVLLFAAPFSSQQSVVASATRLELNHTEGLSEWFGVPEAAQRTRVPAELRRVLSCFTAWTLPIATPGGCYGAVALPTLDLSFVQQRRVARLVCDFALRFERAERCRILERLRIEEVTASHPRLTSVPANAVKFA
jgi:hypothetical protein